MEKKLQISSIVGFLFLLVSILLGTAAPLGAGARPLHPGAWLEQAEPTAAPQKATKLVLPVIMKPDRVYGFQVLTPDVPPFGKFEAQFGVHTPATHPSLPYDENPPAGLKAKIGLSVDVLFSQDDFQTTLVQPAFYYQPFRYSTRSGKDHFTPTGGPRWVVRFTPQQAGQWKYRVRVIDSKGTFYFPKLESDALSFHTSDPLATGPGYTYARRGFLRVSPTDPRYFEFGDGTPFIGAGFNDSFHQVDQVEAQAQTYENFKMNFMRVWMSGAGINGSQWSSWGSHHLPMDGYIPAASLDFSHTFSGADVAWKLDNQNPCLFADFWQGGIPVEPDTQYTVWARMKLDGVRGPASSGEWGFVIKQAEWLDKDCAKTGKGKFITRPIQGSTGWITVSGNVTTGSQQSWLDTLYLTRQNATAGTVYIDEVRLWRSNDPSQVNLLREPYANSHMAFDPINSARWDRFIESAERHGVYLKLVIDEKNEWIRNRLLENGAMSGDGNNDNFYAQDGSKSRWLQEAWWRYLIARWGYSTAIHSFEYVNEGDPYNGNHYAAANAIARYFDENDPSRHMVTTSFWSSFPNREFWSNESYSAIDYADLHAYISTGWGLTASLLEAKRTETNPQHVRTAPASARLEGVDNDADTVTPRGLVLHGAGEWIVRYWMKAQGFTANCPRGTQGGMQRVRWILDGGKNAGGREGIVPANQEGQDFICTSPAGSYGWTEFRSDRDRDGRTVPAEYRLVLHDDQPHEFSLRIENNAGTGGTAWIDDIELIAPSGEVVDVLGHFDTTPMDDDTAWYQHAYGDVFGGGSHTGARKPLVRGETGIDFPDQQTWNRDLLNDIGGVWLHNNIWGQANHTGMLDLFWWADETIPESLFVHFLTFQNFMAGIPLNNGRYRDAAAQTSTPALRAWGQRDDTQGWMHLWVQNTQHTWKRVVYGPPIQPVSGAITIPGVAPGRYSVEWWNTYTPEYPVFKQEILNSDGSLVLTLPVSLSDDIAVKIRRVE